MKKLSAIFVLLFGLSVAYAQNAVQSLNRAEDDYESGILKGIPDRIYAIMGELGKTERIRAKRLLTLIYIFSDEEQKAGDALVDLLIEEPEYQLDSKVDPAELFYLYGQYRTDPILKVGLRAGMNLSHPFLLGEYGTYNFGNGALFVNGRSRSGAKERMYSGLADTSNVFPEQGGLQTGWWAEAMAERHVGRGLELGAGAQIRASRYRGDQFNAIAQSVSWTNKQLMLRMPIQVKYTYNYFDRGKKILPYALAGISYDYLLSAKTDAEGNFGITVTENGLDLKKKNQVNVHNMSYYLGAGAKYRVKTHFLSLELRYDVSQFNYINGGNRYTNQASVYELGYVEPDLKLNMFSFSIGYTYSVHNPKLLKSK